MLSAFVARPLVEVRQRDKSKIESILAHGDRLFVGLNTGSLRIYRVNEVQEDGGKQNGVEGKPASRPGSATTTRPVDLLREVEKFAPKSIEQLAIIREASVLISLSNYVVSIHDLESYGLQEQLSKNATTFAVTSDIVKDSTTGILDIVSKLAVAVKRKLLLWSWNESELSPDVTEITLPASIRTLTWSSATKIICGMTSGYVIVDVISQEVEDIVGPGAIGGAPGSEGGRFGGVGSASMGYMGLGGYTPRPLIARLGEGEMLLAKDINSLFVDSDGKPLEKRQVPWQQAPESIGYSYPYLVSLQSGSKGNLEVRNPETLSLLQTIPLPNASQLHSPPPTVSLSHAGKGFHVSSDRCIWRMAATDYDAQIDQLVEGGRYDESISLLNMLEDALVQNKEDRIREIKMNKAQLLFDQRRYRQALDLFTEVKAPPERVIKLYPKLIAGDLASLPDDRESHGMSAEGTKGDDHGESVVTSDAPEEISSKPAALGKLLVQHKKAPSVDAGSIRSKKGEVGDASDTASIIGKPVEDAPLEGKDLTNAVLELNAFLVDTRTRLQRFLDPTTGKLRAIDANGQNGSSKESFQSLLVAPSSEEDIGREQELVETAKLVDTTLFRAYMFARPSLAGALFRIPNFCDPDTVNEKLLANSRYNDLVDFFHGKKLHRPALELLRKFGEADETDETAPMLRGPQRTVGYLQNLPPDKIDLILEFARWPLQVNPDLGMEIFLADTENAEKLPRDRVVAFLEDIDQNLAGRYLEHLVNELDDSTPEFHNRLVCGYIKELRDRDDTSSDGWQEKMERLRALLRSSKRYSLRRAFDLIPKDDAKFYEAQAIVLSNMGSHQQALMVYVFKLKDFDKAEEYCNHVHLMQESPVSSPIPSHRTRNSEPDDAPPSIYHILLSLYLTPPPPYQPSWPPALSLLSKHGSRLPADSTLKLMPSTLPVAELESYFQGRIRAANSIVNESRVVAGLRKSEVVRAQAMLLLGDGLPGEAGGRNRRVVVGEERVCGVCHKRLGRSVVAVLPDNAVVHYGCLSRVGSQKGGPGTGGMESLRRAHNNWGH
ncbi:MAG: Vacuolar morphogenesis protein 6 [Claussenomyces sp. TS43310]|nr:MAG: Vacuolar morphogenesis protein 6 [Claussenomyces sp. TS43310]